MQSPGDNPYSPPASPTAVLRGSGLVPAPRELRAGGVTIDSVAAAAAIGLSIAPLLIAGELSSGENTPLTAAGWAFFLAGIAAFLGAQAYFVATRGQSVGKMVVGTKIVQMDGSPTSFVKGVLLRSWLVTLVANIPIVGYLFATVDVLMIFNADCRCLHDRLAGTQVVMKTDAQ